MPLGNARDFGLTPEDDPILPMEEQLRAAENLGQPVEDEGVSLDEIAVHDPFAEAEVGEYLGGQTFEGTAEENEAALAELVAYLDAMKPEYPITPTDLVVLKNEGIITTEEARAYLEGKGVFGG